MELWARWRQLHICIIIAAEHVPFLRQNAYLAEASRHCLATHFSGAPGNYGHRFQHEVHAVWCVICVGFVSFCECCQHCISQPGHHIDISRMYKAVIIKFC